MEVKNQKGYFRKVEQLRTKEATRFRAGEHYQTFWKYWRKLLAWNCRTSRSLKRLLFLPIYLHEKQNLSVMTALTGLSLSAGTASGAVANGGSFQSWQGNKTNSDNLEVAGSGYDASGFDKLVVIATTENANRRGAGGMISTMTYDGVAMTLAVFSSRIATTAFGPNGTATGFGNTASIKDPSQGSGGYGVSLSNLPLIRCWFLVLVWVALVITLRWAMSLLIPVLGSTVSNRGATGEDMLQHTIPRTAGPMVSLTPLLQATFPPSPWSSQQRHRSSQSLPLSPCSASPGSVCLSAAAARKNSLHNI